MSRSQKSVPEPEYNDEPELLPSSSSIDPTSTANEINLKVQHVQEQLLDLKRQQEEIERQKRDLEDLSRKQREFDEGRREIVEKLTRGLVLLERQEFEVKRELDQIKIVRDSFAEHLGQTENLNPTDWSSEELPTELTKALARVDQAKSIYSQSRSRLAALRQTEEGQGEIPLDDLAPDMTAYEKSFGSMVREGFAYSLSLLLLGIFALLAYLVLHH
jgi:chromosome segregation ATPase